MKKLLAALAVSAALSPLSSAHAGTISFEHTKAMTLTNWNETFSLGKFDTSLGTLTSVRFDLSGTIQASGSAESNDSKPSTATLTLGSMLSLTGPGNSALVMTNPVFSQVFNFSGYDGTLDFGGTSGGTTGPISTSAQSFFTANPSDFSLFSALGGGTVNLGMSAVGNSSFSGAGNLTTLFNTSASATAKVTYTYTSAVEIPEPASLATMLAGLGLIGALRRRTHTKA